MKSIMILILISVVPGKKPYLAIVSDKGWVWLKSLLAGRSHDRQLLKSKLELRFVGLVPLNSFDVIVKWKFLGTGLSVG